MIKMTKKINLTIKRFKKIKLILTIKINRPQFNQIKAQQILNQSQMMTLEIFL